MNTQKPIDLPAEFDEENAHEVRLTQQDVERQKMRETEAGYRAAAVLSQSIQDAVKTHGRPNPQELKRLKDSVLGLYHNYGSSKLLESLFLVRLDSAAGYYTYHAVNVALLNLMIAELLGMTMEEQENLATIGLVIDFGMLRLPPRILDSKTKLTDNERVVIRNHTQATVRLLKGAGITDPHVLDGVLYHHERYGGDGYPLRLAGPKIPMEARITAVSDSFDAANSRKTYREDKSPFDVLAELFTNPGGALDPGIVRIAVMGFAEMMVDKHILLSDRSIGRVVSVDLNNLAYPQVRVVGRTVQTGPELRPVSFASYMPLF